MEKQEIECSKADLLWVSIVGVALLIIILSSFATCGGKFYLENKKLNIMDKAVEEGVSVNFDLNQIVREAE